MLRNIDYVGPACTIKIEKRDIYKTSIGGIMTILLLIFSNFSCIGFGRDIIERKKPLVNMNRNINDNLFYNLTDTSFIFTLFNQADVSPIKDLDRKFSFYFSLFNFTDN
jgi:hypothetical protein